MKKTMLFVGIILLASLFLVGCYRIGGSDPCSEIKDGICKEKCDTGEAAYINAACEPTSYVCCKIKN